MARLRALRWSPLAALLAIAALLGVLAAGGHVTHGQTSDTPTAAASSATTGTTSAAAQAGPEQPIENDDAVRLVLPADIQNSTKLPVKKWARADMWDASGVHTVFIATIFPYVESGGSASYRLIANYLRWDGAEWAPALPGYGGVALTGDNLWLAQNLNDITAYATPPDSIYQGFVVTFTAQGQYSATDVRTETVAAIYDMTLNESWSRMLHLQDVDTSNPGYTSTHSEDVDWAFQTVNGAVGIVANVTDTDQIALTGPADPSLPQPGTTQTTSTETYILGSDGTFVSLSPGGAPPQPATSPPAGTSTPAAATSATPAPSQPTQNPTPPPTRAPTVCAAPGILVPKGVVAPPTCGPTPQPAPAAQGTPAG